MSAEHWAGPYIGKGWRYGGQGPDEFDCWNFVREVQRARFGIEVPIIEYEQDQRDVSNHLQHNPELEKWTPVESPREGDIVMMARAKIPAHVGVWIIANGRAGILHCVKGIGVVFTQAAMVRSSGWGNLRYYRRKTA